MPPGFHPPIPQSLIAHNVAETAGRPQRSQQHESPTPFRHVDRTIGDTKSSFPKRFGKCGVSVTDVSQILSSCAEFHAPLQPITGFQVVDVHELSTDRTTVCLLKTRDNLPERLNVGTA